VVVRGEGPTFSAGIDLFQVGTLGAETDGLRTFRRDSIEMVNLLEEMPKPVVAQIQGGCIGLGAELALACDLRVMADDVKFGLPEVRLGLIPDVGGSKELIMTGRLIGAEECLRIGAANRIAPVEQLDQATDELVEELLAASPLATGYAKRVLDGVAKPTLAASLELEVSFQQTLVGSEDFREAAASYVEKREPSWTRRTPAAPEREHA
jgi:enoyl-CoA hydratase/carnithine racemase